MEKTKQYLLLFTIGPVQSFIAQARKTQDLYAGSQLLSTLIKTAMDKLKDECSNVKFIFPKPQEGSDISYPNRFIASFSADKNKLKTLGNELKEKVVETLKNEFYKTSVNFIKTEFKNNNNQQKEKFTKDPCEQLDGFLKDCCKQLDGFLDINWVILPYDPDNPKDYQTKYKEIERTLGAVKNVRAFDQLEEQGKKCSLCGERNVLFFLPTKYSPEEYRIDYQKKAHIQADAINISHLNNKETEYKFSCGEGLCAVCFTKRFYEKTEFPSTAGIALMDTLNKLKNNNYKDLIKDFEDGWDEQLIYEENLTEKYFEKNSLPLNKLDYFKKKHSEIKAALKAIEKNTNEKTKLKLTRYYAIIALDGDSMGKWLSGDNINNPETELLKFHKNLSEKLGDYAGNVKDYYIKEDDGSGKLVYAGGDDVLAFVNLNHLTEVLAKLRKNFPDFDGSKKSSASCGVAIAHYKTPLGETLKWAKKMEHDAKEKGDRNAFAIAVLKRSGEIEKTVFKWNYNGHCEEQSDVAISSIGLLGDLINHLKKENFSNTFIKSLNMEFRKLMDNEGKIDNTKIDEIIKIELERLVERSRNKNDKDITKDQALELAGKIYKLYKSKSDDIRNFLSFLNIADFLHREVNK